MQILDSGWVLLHLHEVGCAMTRVYVLCATFSGQLRHLLSWGDIFNLLIVIVGNVSAVDNVRRSLPSLLSLLVLLNLLHQALFDV